MLLEVRKRNGPINFLGASIPTHNKLEAPLRRVVYVTLMVGSIVIHGDFGVGSEKGGEAFDGSLRKKRGSIGIRMSRFDKVFKFLFDSLVIIKEDGVVSRNIITGRVGARGG